MSSPKTQPMSSPKTQPMSSPKTPSSTSDPTEETTFATSIPKAQSAIQSLFQVIDHPPPPYISSDSPSLSLLQDTATSEEITSLLRQPLSGTGDDNICRWLYDTFQSSDSSLQLVVLRFLPTLAGVYLIRSISRKPLAGFEAVLLAIYAHVTKSRNGQPLTVRIPNLSHPSLYHETNTKTKTKNIATELHIAIVSPVLEPHGTVRSTKRARIVGVALELYYSKISQLPTRSKLDFCEFCEVWAGQEAIVVRDRENSATLSGTKEDGQGSNSNSNSNSNSTPEVIDGKEDGEGSNSNSTPEEIDGVIVCKKKSVKEECREKGGRIPLPWELLQPCLRILSHCLLGHANPPELKEAAFSAVGCMYTRALHDVDPQMILATESLLKLGKREMELMEVALDSRDSAELRDSPENLVVFTA